MFEVFPFIMFMEVATLKVFHRIMSTISKLYILAKYTAYINIYWLSISVFAKGCSNK